LPKLNVEDVRWVAAGPGAGAAAHPPAGNEKRHEAPATADEMTPRNTKTLGAVAPAARAKILNAAVDVPSLS